MIDDNMVNEQLVKKFIALIFTLFMTAFTVRSEGMTRRDESSSTIMHLPSNEDKTEIAAVKCTIIIQVRCSLIEFHSNGLNLHRYLQHK